MTTNEPTTTVLTEPTPDVLVLLMSAMCGTDDVVLEQIERLTVSLTADDMPALLTASGNLSMRCAVLAAHLAAAAGKLLPAEEIAALAPHLAAERTRLSKALKHRGRLHEPPEGNA